MGSFLQNLGRTAFEHKWWFIGGWTVVLIVVGVLAANFATSPTSTITIPGTEAQKTLDHFKETFPDADVDSGRLVFEATDGTTLTDHTTTIQSIVDDVKDVPDIASVTAPSADAQSISSDKTVGYATVTLSGSDSTTGTTNPDTTNGIKKIVDAAQSKNLSVAMSGELVDQVPEDLIGISEFAGVGLALVVLVITLGALIAAGLPLIVAGVAVGLGAGGLFALSRVIEVNSTTPVLAVMLGLAVGIDYSLFIVNKYRHYLKRGFSYADASAKAVATAGNAVIFAALTVVIALSALSVVGIPFLTSMGLSAAATVALAAIISITLLPALFGLVKSRIFAGKTRRQIIASQKQGAFDDHTVRHTTKSYKFVSHIARRPALLLIVSVLVIGVAIIPIKSLSLSLPMDKYAAAGSSEHQAYQMMTRGFGEGSNGPLLVVADDLPKVTDKKAAELRHSAQAKLDAQIEKETAAGQKQLQQQLAAAQSPQQAQAIEQKAQQMAAEGEQQKAEAQKKMEAQLSDYIPRYHLLAIAKNIEKRDDVKKAVPALVTDDTTKGMIQIIPAHGPSSASTENLIHDLRDETTVKKLTDSPATTFGVTGITATMIDINQKLSDALPVYLMVIVGLSFLLLVVVFRSILVPLKATLGFLLSVGAMFGATVAIFQWGWFDIADAPGPLMSFIPIIAIGVLFGLAMDYEFFLVSSMHEEFARTKDAHQAVTDGYAAASRIVLAAAFIMVAVFASFIGNHDATIQPIGFALAFGIFVDAFIVRLIIVPAVMSLLGKSAWWLPNWLKKILPNLSIEGEA